MDLTGNVGDGVVTADQLVNLHGGDGIGLLSRDKMGPYLLEGRSEFSKEGFKAFMDATQLRLGKERGNVAGRAMFASFVRHLERASADAVALKRAPPPPQRRKRYAALSSDETVIAEKMFRLMDLDLNGTISLQQITVLHGQDDEGRNGRRL